MLKAILILPFNVLISIPLLILYFSDFEPIEIKNIVIFSVYTICKWINTDDLDHETFCPSRQRLSGSLEPDKQTHHCRTLCLCQKSDVARCLFIFGRRMFNVSKLAIILLSADFHWN